MKKVININFQGRVIPIEDSAFDALKQYIDSLRAHFAREEGADEIINDIEGRIAELFSETLKHGATCITDEEVNTIINSMGRPEELGGDDTISQPAGSASAQASAGYAQVSGRERLFRDENDKVLGGVCSGIAHYFRIDPAIVRILFAVFSLGSFGTGLLIYILLWAVLPVRGLERNLVKRRLFRNPDEKVIAGVAGGIATYFDIAVWIPRVIFALPLILSIVSSIFSRFFWYHHDGPSFIFGSFGSTFFVMYVVLWFVMPEANSASEKLEMRGEKVDLNSIKNTIQEDLGQFRKSAERWSGEARDRARSFGSEFGQTMRDKGQAFGDEVRYATRSGSRFWQAIGVVFKAFFLFLAGIIAFSLLMGLIGIAIGGSSVYPLRNFFLENSSQVSLTWAVLCLFIGVPIIALFTWVVRRILRVRSKSPYLGLMFGGLWIIGLICAIVLAASITRNYDARSATQSDAVIAQPSHGKMVVVADEPKATFTTGDDETWFDDNGLFYGASEDSMWLRNVRVILVKSPDTLFHVRVTKFSYGRTPGLADANARQISFEPRQSDSLLMLPSGFSISSATKFHVQQVAVTVEVPIGKHIIMDESLHNYQYFTISERTFRRHRWSSRQGWTTRLDDSYDWSDNVEYIMTEKGLRRKELSQENYDEDDRSRKELDDLDREQRELDEKKQHLRDNLIPDSNRYHYQPAQPAPSKPVKPARTAKAGKPTPHGLLSAIQIPPGTSGLMMMQLGL